MLMECLFCFVFFSLIQGVLRLREERWESADVGPTPRNSRNAIELSNAHIQPREGVEQFLSVVALLANFATFEDWLGFIFSRGLGADVYSRILRLILQNSFDEGEYGEFLQYSSLLFENTLATPFAEKGQILQLLASSAPEQLVAKLLQDLQKVCCLFFNITRLLQIY